MSAEVDIDTIGIAPYAESSVLMQEVHRSLDIHSRSYKCEFQCVR